MRRYTAFALFLIIVVSVLVMFRSDKWATSIPEVACCGLAAMWGVAFLSGQFRPRLDRALLPLALLIAWAAVQVFTGVTVYAWQTWVSVIYWSGNLAVLFAALQAFADDKTKDWILRALVLFGFVVCIQAALQALTTNHKIFWIFSTEYSDWDLLGPFVYHNQFAAFVELLLPVAIYYALADLPRRVFYSLIAATMYASVIVAASRTGVVLATAEMFAVPVLVLRRRATGEGGLKRFAAGLAAMVVLLALAAGPNVLAGRFIMKDPYAMRREFVRASVAMIWDRPLAGVGMGNWATVYPAYALFEDGRFANQAHNDWLQWAVEGGLPGFCLMLAFAFLVVPGAVRTGWGCGVAAIFVHCLVDYPIQRTGVAVVFFSLIAASIPASRKNRAVVPIDSYAPAPNA